MYYSNLFLVKRLYVLYMNMMNRMDFLFFWDNFSTYNGTCGKLKPGFLKNSARKYYK